MVPKPMAYLSQKKKKIHQKVHGIVSQEFELYLIKSMKNGSQMKSFQSIVNTLVRGHICSFLQVR